MTPDFTISLDTHPEDAVEEIHDYLIHVMEDRTLANQFQFRVINHMSSGEDDRATLTMIAKVCEDLGIDVEWESEAEDAEFLWEDTYGMRQHLEPQAKFAVFLDRADPADSIKRASRILHRESKTLWKEFAARVRSNNRANHDKPDLDLRLLALCGDYFYFTE